MKLRTLLGLLFTVFFTLDAFALDEAYCKEHFFEFPCFGGPSTPEWTRIEWPESWPVLADRPPICHRAMGRCNLLLNSIARKICVHRLSNFEIENTDIRCDLPKKPTLPSCRTVIEAQRASKESAGMIQKRLEDAKHIEREASKAVELENKNYQLKSDAVDSSCPPDKSIECRKATRALERAAIKLTKRQLERQRASNEVAGIAHESDAWKNTLSILNQAVERRECVP